MFHILSVTGEKKQFFDLIIFLNCVNPCIFISTEYTKYILNPHSFSPAAKYRQFSVELCGAHTSCKDDYYGRVHNHQYLRLYVIIYERLRSIGDIRGARKVSKN